MAAFSKSDMMELRYSLKRFVSRAEHLRMFTMTPDEYYAALVPAHIVETLRTVAPVIVLQWGQLPLTIGERKFLLRGSQDAPLVSVAALREDAPEAFVTRLNRWASGIGDFDRDASRVYYVLHQLNELCSQSALRYYWPAILPIASSRPQTAPIAEKLAALKQPSTSQQLPAGLADACRKTMKTMALYSLLPETPPVYPGVDKPTIMFASTGRYYENGTSFPSYQSY